jgi:hypothetical protein
MSCHLWKPEHSSPSSQKPFTELYSDSQESVSDGGGRGSFRKFGNSTLTKLISRQELLPTHNLTSCVYTALFSIILVITPSAFRTKTVYSSPLACILHAPPTAVFSNYVWLAAAVMTPRQCHQQPPDKCALTCTRVSFPRDQSLSCFSLHNHLNIINGPCTVPHHWCAQPAWRHQR